MIFPINLSDRFAGGCYVKQAPEQKSVVCKRGQVLNGPDISFKVKSDYQGATLEIRSTYPVTIYKHFVDGDYPLTDGEKKYVVETGEFEGFYDAISDLQEGEKIEVLDFLTDENVATVHLELRNPVARICGNSYLLVGNLG